MGDGQEFHNTILIKSHIKYPVVTLFISEGGAYISVNMQYGSWCLDILEVPFQKCVMLGSASVKV